MRLAPRACATGLTLLSLLALTSCGKHYWGNVGAGPEDFARDSGECARENALYWGATTEFGTVLQDQYKDCLKSRAGCVLRSSTRRPRPGIAVSRAMKRCGSTRRHRSLRPSRAKHPGRRARRVADRPSRVPRRLRVLNLKSLDTLRLPAASRDFTRKRYHVFGVRPVMAWECDVTGDGRSCDHLVSTFAVEIPPS
jgi:hypothetical protein